MTVLASLGSWLPFAIAFCVITIFSVIFTLRYQQKKHRNYVVTCVCSISLIIALLTASLLPTDIMLVSFMKNTNGLYKDWAKNQTLRDEIQKNVEIGYYVLYGLIIVMAFLVNPFLFFYYEEKEDTDRKPSKRICSAIKWMIGFLFFLLILILLGVFIPQIAGLPQNNTNTDWEEVKYLVDHFNTSRFQDTITFTIFTVSIIGFFLLTLYTGYGSIGLPLFLIRGKRSARLQQESIEEKLSAVQSQIEAIKKRYPRENRMPPGEKSRLEDLQQQEMTLNRNEESIKVLRRSCWFKCRFFYRPMQIIFGVLLVAIALLIFISLLLSDINKCIHFNGFKHIFAQGNKSLPNPIDIIVTWTGRFYPLSYIVIMLLLAYIIMTSIFGLQQLGIWYFWVRMYRFSRGRTKPQALLMLASFMMFIVVAINIFAYLLIPQYSIYGDQNYAVVVKYRIVAVKPCTQYVTPGLCQITVMGRIILLFFYKVWFFGAVYFILSWLFLVIFIGSCIKQICSARGSNIQEFSVDRLLEDDNDEDVPLIQ